MQFIIFVTFIYCWICALAGKACSAQCKRSAGCAANLTRSLTRGHDLHGERLGRHSGLQLLPVPCPAFCGRPDHPSVSILLLLQNHRQHGVRRLSSGRQRLLPGESEQQCYSETQRGKETIYIQNTFLIKQTVSYKTWWHCALFGCRATLAGLLSVMVILRGSCPGASVVPTSISQESTPKSATTSLGSTG